MCPADDGESPGAREARLQAELTGCVLRLLRERQGYTQEGLGRRAGLRQRDLSRLETGEGRADIVRLQRLSRALGMRDEDLRAFVQDAWDRAGLATCALISEAVGAWWELAERALGEHGRRCLFEAAAAAALHPWPR